VALRTRRERGAHEGAKREGIATDKQDEHRLAGRAEEAEEKKPRMDAKRGNIYNTYFSYNCCLIDKATILANSTGTAFPTIL